MKLRQIISGALAFAITANSMTFLNNSLSASAESRVEWEGYDKSVSFDTWDGTYDTSWFTENTGTKDDPYIIDSAEAFAGIYKKSVTSGSFAEGEVVETSKAFFSSDIDLFVAGSRTAVKKGSTVRQQSNWYDYTWSVPFTYSYNFSYTYDTQDISVDGAPQKHYYLTNVFLDVVINGVSKSVDITDYIKQTVSLQENSCIFSPFENTEFYELSQLTYITSELPITSVSSLENVVTTLKSKWKWTAPLQDEMFYMYSDTQTTPDSFDEEGSFLVPIGSFAEFDVIFPEITATNSAGETVTIDNSNYKNYYLNVSKGTLNLYSVALTESNVVDTLKSSAYHYFTNTEITERESDDYIEYTSIVSEPVSEMDCTVSDVNYFYFQSTDSEVEFDEDTNFYYGTVKSELWRKYTCEVTLKTNQIVMEMTCTDINGNIVDEWTETQSFTAGAYNYFDSFSLRAYKTASGVMTFVPSLKLGRVYNDKYYKSTMSLKNFTHEDTPCFEDIQNKKIFDVNGNELVYDDVISDLTYVGKAKTVPSSVLSIINRKLYTNEALPELVAENDNTNPTFEGKYFKLTADIETESMAFPFAADGLYNETGLGADFNMNGHVISGGGTLFGNITETGKLHNGVITQIKKTSQSIIGDNYGVISDVSVIPYNAFTMSGEAYSINETSMITNNFGNIEDCEYISYDTTSFCGCNLGVIDGLDVLYTFFDDNITIGYGIKCNYGVLKNVYIDTDRDVYDLQTTSFNSYKNDYWKSSLYPFVMYNLGVVDTFEVADFTVVNNGASFFKPIQYDIDGVEYYNVSYLYNNNENDSISILAQTVSSASQAPLTNYSISGKHTIYKNLKVKGDFGNADFNFPLSSYYYNPQAFYTKLIDCDIDITVEDTTSSDGILFGTFIDSDIKIVARGENVTSYVNGVLECNLINSDLYISDVASTLFHAGVLENSNIHIGNMKNGALFYGAYNINSSTALWDTAKNCTFTVDNFTVDNYDSVETYSSFISYYGYSGVICSDCDFIFNSVTGTIPYNFGGDLDNCRIMINYSGELTTKDTTNLWHNGLYSDCEFYYTFDDNATGEIGTLLAGATSGKDVFIYVEEMPDEVTFSSSCLTGLGAAAKNVTVLAPKINLSADVTHFSPFGNQSGNTRDSNYIYRNAPVENLNAIVNVYMPEDSLLESASALTAYYASIRYNSSPNIYPIIHGINAMLNIYDENRSNANIPVYGITSKDFGNETNARINNVVIYSNTISSDSALVDFYTNNIITMLRGRSTPLLWKCYLDLPNVNNTQSPSAEADFTTSGFVQSNHYGYSYNGEAGVYSSAVYYLDKLAFSNCYIPEGQSAVVQSFSSDESVIDTWNMTDSWLSENAVNWSIDWEGTEHFEFGELADGITEVSADAYTNGELAYLLDGGYNGTRRTYLWSVIEPDTVVYNSITNEPLYTLPEITWRVNSGIPERCLDENVNLKPVFKTTVKEAQDGYIKAVGIGGTSTTSGDIYVKQGAYVVEEAVPTTDEVALIYATQKLGDAIAVKIPNTPRASAYSLRARSADTGYDITGYTQQGIDTEITPVFKTARYISVDIENPENGTVIPSAYVSAEGEKITVSIQAETGYIVNNIKINGQPLTESFFFMPDEDVLITGECVPFEGGITSFSLFGVAGEIDQIAHTITVNVPKSQYVSNALPVIEYYGDYIVPSVSTRTDFTNPVEYTVYYGDNQSVTYEVTVNQSEYTMKIYDFVINGVHGKIDQANRTISIGLPNETDLRNLVPEDIAYSAETISPAVDEARDFTVDQIYTLYTTGMTPVNYVVSVHSADEDTAQLTKFVVSGYEGVIDDENLTVTLTVPKNLDLTNVAPDLIEYEGKKISPSKVEEVDLNDAEYSITSQSGIVNTYTIKVNYISDDEVHIDRFVLAGEEGVIDEDEKTITVTISKNVNITGITPDIIEYTGKSIYPSDEEEQDFTLPVTYTVVAPDNTEVEYEIVIDWLENKADLLEFAILGYEGVIDHEKKTVEVTIPYGIDVTDTPPSKLVVSTNADVTPTIIEHQDFTQPVVYTVVSQDKTVTNDYTINVTIEKPDTIAEITEFKIDEYEGKIDQDEGIITVTLPFDYPQEELENKIPEIVWSGKDISPDEDEPQDFTKPVEYIVTAEDSDVKKDYDIIIKYEDVPYVPSKDAEITEFKIDEYEGEIDPDKGTITVTLPYDYPEEELKNKVPEIKWVGNDITPDDDKPQNFTEPVTYTVTAEDPTITKDYDIVIKYVDPDKEAKIVEFKIDEYEGEINDEDGTITVTLPFDYPQDELENKVPEIIWVGKDIDPDDNEAQDFTEPLTYKVTAEDPTITKEYDIVIDYEDPSTDAKIVEFYIDSYKGIINQDKGIIIVTVPYNYPDSELKNKVPSIIWVGKDITPNEDEAQDFTEDVKYTVTAQDPSVKKAYDIVVKHADKPVTPVIPSTPTIPEKDKEAKIIEFYIDEHKAEIDQDKGIITITLPADYPEEELRNKVPEIIWVGEDIEPDENKAQDFTKPLSYTVTAEDPTISKKYDIIVEFAPEQTPDVEETPEEDDSTEEEEEETPSEDPVEENDPVEEDETPEKEEEIPEEDDEEIEEDDGPVPTGIALSFVPFIVSAVTVVVSGKMGKKNTKDDK